MKKITVRLNETDYEHLIKQTEFFGTSQNELIRELLRKNKIEDIKEYNNSLKGIFRLLKNMSNNLNQLSKKSHYNEDVNSIKKELKELWQFLKE